MGRYAILFSNLMALINGQRLGVLVYQHRAKRYSEGYQT